MLKKTHYRISTAKTVLYRVTQTQLGIMPLASWDIIFFSVYRNTHSESGGHLPRKNTSLWNTQWIKSFFGKILSLYMVSGWNWSCQGIFYSVKDESTWCTSSIRRWQVEKKMNLKQVFFYQVSCKYSLVEVLNLFNYYV